MSSTPTICLSCIGDDSLRDIADDSAEPISCSYCQVGRHGISLEKLAMIVDEPLRTYCCHGEYYRPVFRRDSDRRHHRQRGDALDSLLQEELGIDHDPASDLIPILKNNDSEGFFDSEQKFHRRDFPNKYAHDWSEFQYRVCHERRFFDDTARAYLAEILGEPDSDQANELPTIELGPGTNIESIFRARRAESGVKVGAIRQHPAGELGPPPANVASAGRMNPAGISVFYGALSEDTAIAEVRPSVGSLVVIGRFSSSRVLRLLDLTQIGIGFTASIFRSDCKQRMTRLRFLEAFHTLIARPVQPHEELINYIPTQAVAEYVANVLSFDGMLYASAQLGSVPRIPRPTSYSRLHKLKDKKLGYHNVVLLGAAARVDLGDEPTTAYPELGEGWTLLASPEPAMLSLCSDSVRCVRITAVSYRHEWTPL
ncbi:MAG: RES family NAD+ phosphorylase [Nitrospinae bacterium]|nr:RES family NAD+ phosphorylase [Nitrospinota bacterium]